MKQERQLEVFADYLRCLRTLASPCIYTSYDDTFGGEIRPREFAYLHIAEGRSRDLANTLNEFCHYLNQLQAWQIVLSHLDEDERLDVLFEFVQPLAFLCLGQPYVIEQRMYAAVQELSREANRVTGRGPIDKPRKAGLNNASRVAAAWDGWEPLASSLRALNSRRFMSRVYNFRHEFHHGFPRQVEIGLTPFVEVVAADGFIRTSVGAKPPLLVSSVTEALREQHSAATECFQQFLVLMREQRMAVHG